MRRGTHSAWDPPGESQCHADLDVLGTGLAPCHQFTRPYFLGGGGSHERQVPAVLTSPHPQTPQKLRILKCVLHVHIWGKHTQSATTRDCSELFNKRLSGSCVCLLDRAI